MEAGNSMAGADSFTTIALVAALLLGFGGVTGIFAGRRRNVAEIQVRLWAMLEFGVAVLCLALLPAVLFQLGVGGTALWTTCSAALWAFLGIHIVFAAPRVARHMEEGVWIRVPPGLALAVPLSYSLSLITQALNTFGVLLERDAGGYLLGLYLFLISASLNFVALILALRPEPDTHES